MVDHKAREAAIEATAEKFLQEYGDEFSVTTTGRWRVKEDDGTWKAQRGGARRKAAMYLYIMGEEGKLCPEGKKLAFSTWGDSLLLQRIRIKLLYRAVGYTPPV